MRRHLYICASHGRRRTGIVGQSTPQAQVSRSAHEQQGTPEPRLNRLRRYKRTGAGGAVLPLVAQGRLLEVDTSPLEATVHALNPRDVNLGAIWEERRRAWLENAGANRYFWYSFGVTAHLS